MEPRADESLKTKVAGNGIGCVCSLVRNCVLGQERWFIR